MLKFCPAPIKLSQPKNQSKIKLHMHHRNVAHLCYCLPSPFFVSLHRIFDAIFFPNYSLTMYVLLLWLPNSSLCFANLIAASRFHPDSKDPDCHLQAPLLCFLFAIAFVIQLVHIVPRREPTPWSVLLSYVSAQMLRVRFSRTGERLLSWSLGLIMKIIW